MYINDNNGWGWRDGKDRWRLSDDRYPPASPSTEMKLPKAVRILYKICGEAATTALGLKGRQT